MKSLNELYQDLHNLEAQLSQTDSIAIAKLEGEDVSAYGDIRTIRHGLWEQIVALKNEIAEAEKAERPEDFHYDKWTDLIGHALEHGKIIEDDGSLYSVITPHIAQAEWKPSLVPAFFAPYSEDEWPEIPEHIPSTSPWMRGDKGTWKGEHYICQTDNCVWNPDEYPVAWQKVV